VIRKLILIFGFFFFYSSCDVPGYLVVQNCTTNKAQYITYFKSQNNVKDTVILEIPVNETKGLLFGLGIGWNNENIRSYISRIDKLEIITRNDTTTLSDDDQLYRFFKRRRRGLFKQGMKIKVK